MIVLWISFLQILPVTMPRKNRFPVWTGCAEAESGHLLSSLLIGDVTVFRVSGLDVPSETFLPACDMNPMTFAKMLLEVHQQNTCGGFCLTDHSNPNCHSVRISPNEAVLFAHVSNHPCSTLRNCNYELWEEFMKIRRVIFSRRTSLKSC